jgi:hypothetical protein
MGETNLAAVEAAVEEVYIKGVRNLQGNTSPTYDEIKQGKAHELNSRGASIVIRPNNNASERWSTAEFEDFAPAGNSTLVKTTVPFVNFYKTAKFSRHVLAEDQNPSKITDLVTGEIDNCREMIDKSQNKFLWGDGSGELARASAFNAGTLVVTCNNAGNLFGVQLLEIGMEVEFRDNAGALKVGGGVTWGRITAISEGNLTFTLSQGPSDVANGDRIYLRDSYNSAPRGFLYQVNNSGAWQGLSDRTVYRGTSPAVVNANGAAMSEGFIRKAVSAMAFKKGMYPNKGQAKGGRKMKVYWNSQRDAFMNAYDEMRIQSDNKLDASWQTVLPGGMADEWDPHIQRDTTWILDTSEMLRFEMEEIGIRKNDAGGIFHQANARRGVGHSDGKLVYWGGFFNYGTQAPVDLGTRIYGSSTTGLELGNNN